MSEKDDKNRSDNNKSGSDDEESESSGDDGNSGSDDEDSIKLNFSTKDLGKKVREESAKLKSMQGGARASILKVINSNLKGMSYGIALLGLLGDIWFMDPLFMRAHCKCVFQMNHPGKPVPVFVMTIRHYNLRNKQYGDNNYMRTARGRSIPVLGWSFQFPTANGGSVKELVQKQAKFIYACFRPSDNHSIGSIALDYVETNSHDDPMNPGKKAGLYKTITKNITDTAGIEMRLTKQINSHFAIAPNFQMNVHFNKYLTDFDIKEFLEKHLGANNWDQVPTDVRKACYKNYSTLNDLPKWNLIFDEKY